LVSLLDEERQWFKSHHGLPVSETPKEIAFCAHDINEPSNLLIVENAQKDKRFHDNPLVTGNPHVLFYAGISLVNENSLPLGTLCVIDNEPKKISESQIQSLGALAKQVMRLLELRRKKKQLERSMNLLEEKNTELRNFAAIAAHDIKAPLNSISTLADVFNRHYRDDTSKEGLARYK
jgi:GAF domain-containing protein